MSQSDNKDIKNIKISKEVKSLDDSIQAYETRKGMITPNSTEVFVEIVDELTTPIEYKKFVDMSEVKFPALALKFPNDA